MFRLSVPSSVAQGNALSDSGASRKNIGSCDMALLFQIPLLGDREEACFLHDGVCRCDIWDDVFVDV